MGTFLVSDLGLGAGDMGAPMCITMQRNRLSLGEAAANSCPWQAFRTLEQSAGLGLQRCFDPHLLMAFKASCAATF